jgi:hypothetical protein
MFLTVPSKCPNCACGSTTARGVLSTNGSMIPNQKRGSRNGLRAESFFVRPLNGTDAATLCSIPSGRALVDETPCGIDCCPLTDSTACGVSPLNPRRPRYDYRHRWAGMKQPRESESKGAPIEVISRGVV